MFSTFMRDYSSYFSNLAFILIFISFLLRDILHLRMMSVLGSVSSLCYGFFIPKGPLWDPIRWNCLFIVVNSWQILTLLYQRRHQAWGQQETFLFQRSLKTFPKYEVKNFLSLAEVLDFMPGNHLIRKDTKLDKLFLILEGDVQVLIEGREVAALKSGEFLGEMSFLTNDLTRADVVAKNKVQVYSWTIVSLQSWMKQDPARRGYLQSALGGQLINQLMKKNLNN